ncbi:MAG: MarR family winged helix-turn-helix transcriptional regulator [Pseudomonadota bacterium]
MTHQSPDTPPIDLRSFLTFRLSRLQAQMNSQAQHILRAHSDVGQTEWRVLLLVHSRGESTMAHVVRDGEIDKAQVSRAVKGLTRKGYLDSRVDAGDHRQSILTLTPSGNDLYHGVVPHMRARQEHFTSGLSDAELDVMYKILDRLESAAQNREF